MTLTRTSSMADITGVLRQAVAMEREMVMSLLDAAGSVDVMDLGRQVRRAVPRGGCDCAIPEPCWMPLSMGDLASFAAPCRTACVDVVVTNCDAAPRRITVAFDGDAKDISVSDADFVLGPLRQKVVSVCLTVPDDATRGQRFDGLVWVRGCRDHYLRWTVRVNAFGMDSRHEVEVEDCPDYVHHWYDHFYCARPCFDDRHVVGTVDKRG
jgi:hypothetical protein